MRTVVGLANSNCAFCLNLMSGRLAARPLVRSVHLDAAAGCLVVDHDHDDPEALVAQIHDDLRGWEVAENGERLMVDLGVHEESACPSARTVGGRQAGSDSHRVHCEPQAERGR